MRSKIRLTSCSSGGSAQSWSNGVINLSQPLNCAADSNSISWFRPPLMGCLLSLIHGRISCSDMRASWEDQVMIKKRESGGRQEIPSISHFNCFRVLLLSPPRDRSILLTLEHARKGKAIIQGFPCAVPKHRVSHGTQKNKL